MMDIFEKLISYFNRKTGEINFHILEIPYIAKGSSNSITDATTFGTTFERYNFWRPYICGVCCLKMVGDACGRTTHMTLNILLEKCIEEKVFLLDKEKDVLGAFHYPLAKVMRTLKIPAKVIGNISVDDIILEIKKGKVILLSIDLSKSTYIKSNESHLVVVYDIVDNQKKGFRLHDCSSVLSENGNGMFITKSELSNISNRKGLLIG